MPEERTEGLGSHRRLRTEALGQSQEVRKVPGLEVETWKYLDSLAVCVEGGGPTAHTHLPRVG